MKPIALRTPPIRRRLFLQGTGTLITGLTTPDGMSTQMFTAASAADDDRPPACPPTRVKATVADITRGLANALHANWPANFDVHDVRHVLRGSRWLDAVSVTHRDTDRARVAALEASEWLVARTLGAAEPARALILISAAQNSLKISEWKFTINTLRSCLGIDATTVFAVSHDDALGDSIRLTVVVG